MLWIWWQAFSHLFSSLLTLCLLFEWPFTFEWSLESQPQLKEADNSLNCLLRKLAVNKLWQKHKLPRLLQSCTFQMENEDHPSPQFQWWKNGGLQLACEFHWLWWEGVLIFHFILSKIVGCFFSLSIQVLLGLLPSPLYTHCHTYILPALFPHPPLIPFNLQHLSAKRAPLWLFSFFKTKIGWTSITCFHDDSPVHLTAVKLIMETFDWLPPKFNFEKWRKTVEGHLWLVTAQTLFLFISNVH